MVMVINENDKTVKVDHRMQVTIEIYGVKQTAVFDTGADTSVGGLEVYKDLKRAHPDLKLIDKGKYTAHGPGGERLKCLGKIIVPVKIGGVERELPLLIIERCISGILIGRAWLKEHKAKINM